MIFREDNVRSIREGRKTQTRRLVTLREFGRSSTPGYDWTFRDRALRWHDFRDAELRARKCPYGVPGDLLWVRETWGVVRSLGADRDHDSFECVYRADPASAHQWNGASSQGFRWRPSICMPRDASRLTLVVRSVRVERLSAITEADVRAEGFPPEPRGAMGQTVRPGPRDSFIAAFRAMHKLAADFDPWLWVVGFEVAA